MMAEKTLKVAVVVGLYALLFTPLFAPPFISQSFIFPFIVPKVFIFQVFAAIVVGLWAILAVFHPAYRPRWTPVLKAFGILLGVLAVSAFLGVDPAQSFWSTYERGLGLFVFLHFGALLVVFQAMRERVSWTQYFTVSLGVAVVAGIFALFQLYHPEWFLEKVGGSNRPGSFLGNPTFLAAYLLFQVFLGLWLAAEKFRDRHYAYGAAYIAAAVFTSVVILFTQTRGALFGFMFGVLAMVVYGAWCDRGVRLFGRVRLRQAAIGALAAIVLSVSVFWFTRTAPLWQRVPGLNRLTDYQSALHDIGPRLTALRISADAFRERPLLGFGFENFKYAFDARYEPRLLRYGFSETYFDKPHNIIAEYAVTAGLLGLMAYLGLFGALVRGLFRSRALVFFRPFGLAILVSYFIQNLFVFDTFGSYLMFFAVIGFADAMSLPQESGAARAPPRSARPSAGKWSAVAGIALAVMLLVGANVSILYANNRQYWVLNYFLNRMPERAIAAFKNAVSAPLAPYAYLARKDFATSFSQIYTQGVVIADPEQTAAYAMAELETAIREKPMNYYLRLTYADHATLLSALTPAFLEKGEHYLSDAMRMSPRRQQNYYTLAKYNLLRGDHAGALAAMRQAIELDPEVGDAHFFHALIAFEAGDGDLGFRELETAKRLGREPRTADEMRAVANRYGDAERYDEAARWYFAAVQENPEDWEARLKLGLVYYYLGRTDVARENIQTVANHVDLKAAPSYEILRPLYEGLGIRL